MEKIWYNLPIDLVHRILEYGDPCISEKFQGCIDQLKYHRKELSYQRRNTYCRSVMVYSRGLVNLGQIKFYRYILHKSRIKKKNI